MPPARLRESSLRRGNSRFGRLCTNSFDLIIAIFFCTMFRTPCWPGYPSRFANCFPQALLYSLDPSRQRLSGTIGSLLIPKLNAQIPIAGNERELDASSTARLFAHAGLDTRIDFYDFVSSPLAGLLPGWEMGYRAARRVDDMIVRVPLLRRLGSNFEVIAHKPRRA
jgi:hypothetical protein